MEGLHGIILAGGISSRMGFPKALMPIGDSFFLLGIYSKLVAVGAVPVHVVINTGLQSSLSAQVAKFPDARFVLNAEPGRGQSHSLRLGLGEARAAGARAAIVALVDLPLVEQVTIAALADHAASAPSRIVVPRCGEHGGHPFVIPAERFAAFLDAPPDQTTRDILAAHLADTDTVEVTDHGIHQDVDSPEDLAKYSISADMD